MSELIQFTDCTYDCGLCNEPHSYTQGELYELHMDMRLAPKRFTCTVVESEGEREAR